MTDTKFIEGLKSGGYVPGDLSTLPSDISDADRRKVEEYEAEQANERMKATQGQKPTLGQFHVELNPNQYGFAEQRAQGTSPMKGSQGKTETKAEAKHDPLDHDHDGRRGGHIDNRGGPDKK